MKIQQNSYVLPVLTNTSSLMSRWVLFGDRGDKCVEKVREG